MIATVGRLDDDTTVAVARRAVRAGARVELVATAPLGVEGDRRLAELAAAGVGHAATLRSPAPSLDPADLALALRYLPDLRVVVLAADADALGAAAAEAADWSGARLVVLASAGSAGTAGASAAGASAPETAAAFAPETASAIVLEAPGRDPDEAFAGVVANLAARLDAGEAPSAAWDGLERALGLEGRRVSRDPAVGSGRDRSRGR